MLHKINAISYPIFPSGIRSSITTYIIAPAPKARAYGRIGLATLNRKQQGQPIRVISGDKNLENLNY